VQSEEFSLTQEFIAQMIGVRRAGVTVAAGTLSQAGLIHYTRGRIKITDRAGLEDFSCECYKMVREEFAWLYEVPPA
jgi:Mn-dependent DtxR family transcriptional regulator